MRSSCTACGYFGIVDRAHFATRASGAGWSEDEYLLLCRKCHVSQGTGWLKFVEKHPHLQDVMIGKGWTFVNVFGVWKLRKFK